MTTNTILTVVGIVTAASVSLVVAYLNRKQMRQIELFRKNPAAGLQPPPHPLVLFLKHKKFTLSICGSSLLIIISELSRQTPFTRMSALFISLGVAGFLSGLLLELFQSVLELLKPIVNLFESQTKVIEGIVEVLDKHGEPIEQKEENQ